MNKGNKYGRRGYRIPILASWASETEYSIEFRDGSGYWTYDSRGEDESLEKNLREAFEVLDELDVKPSIWLQNLIEITIREINDLCKRYNLEDVEAVRELIRKRRVQA